MLNFTLNLNHYEQVRHAIDHAFTKADQAEILELAAGEVENQTKERFDSEQAPDGSTWEPWSKKYEKKRPSGKSLLQDMGLLLQSITSEVRGQQAIVGSDSGVLQAKAGRSYAATHQFGHKKVPARPFIGINKDNEKDIVNAIEHYLQSK